MVANFLVQTDVLKARPANYKSSKENPHDKELSYPIDLPAVLHFSR